MITNIAEFMKETSAYFTNGFPNEVVELRFAEKLSYVKPASLERLFNTLTENFPSTWTPDVKALKEAITASGIITLTNPEEMNTCPVCGNTWASSGLCPKCCYNPEKDGTVEEHREWFTNWKAGKTPRFNANDIIAGIVAKTSIGDHA